MKTFKASKKIEECRVTIPGYEQGDAQNGAAYYKPRKLKVQWSNGDGWEHVSVSRHSKAPSWADMCFIKGEFWSSETSVMQLHPAKSNYVNLHKYCLHMWRPLDAQIPLPPIGMIGWT